MSNYIAVEGCKFSFSVGSGTVKVNSTPSTNIKIKNKESLSKGIYSGNFSFSVSGFNGLVITNKDGKGSGVIIPPLRKVQEKGNNVILQGDSVQVQLFGHAGKEEVTETVTVNISDAGQTIVKGE